MPAGTLRLTSLRFFGAFSSAVRQMPGCNWQRRDTACTVPKVLCSVCLFVLCCSVCCLFCVVLCIVCFVLFCVLFVGFVLFCVLFVLFCVLFVLFRSAYFVFVCVCKCVMYYCHRVATQLQLTNISISIRKNEEERRKSLYCVSVETLKRLALLTAICRSTIKRNGTVAF